MKAKGLTGPLLVVMTVGIGCAGRVPASRTPPPATERPLDATARAQGGAEQTEGAAQPATGQRAAGPSRGAEQTQAPTPSQGAEQAQEATGQRARGPSQGAEQAQEATGQRARGPSQGAPQRARGQGALQHTAARGAARDPSTEVNRLLVRAQNAISAGDDNAARAAIARARASAGRRPDDRFKVAYIAATRAAYQGDYEGAAATLLAYLDRFGEQPATPVAFRIHNTLMMLREAQGDIASALVELDQETWSGLHGTWTADGGEARETHTWLKETWHRAYLERMLAETLSGSRRAAALRYAETARRAYRQLARSMPDHVASIAVLDGYFAALDHDRRGALAAARRVNLAEDDDVEDLYLAAVAFEVGGDAAAARRVQRTIRTTADVYLAVPIMRTFIARDAAAGARGFTPRHPIRVAADASSADGRGRRPSAGL